MHVDKEVELYYFLQILHSFLRNNDRLLDMLFLLLAVILSELQEEPRRKDQVTVKSMKKKMICRFNFFITKFPIIKKPVH